MLLILEAQRVLYNLILVTQIIDMDRGPVIKKGPRNTHSRLSSSDPKINEYYHELSCMHSSVFPAPHAKRESRMSSSWKWRLEPEEEKHESLSCLGDLEWPQPS